MKHIKNHSLLYIIIFLIFAFESVLRITTVSPFISIGLLTVSGFSIFAGSVIYMLSLAFGKKGGKAFAIIATLISAVLSGAQIVYNEIFHTYYTVYSMTHGAQVAQFWKDILIGMGNQALPLITIVTVEILGIFLIVKSGKEADASYSKKVYLKSGCIAMAIAILFVSGSIAGGGKGVNSPFGAIFKVNSIDSSIKHLGFTAAAFLDAERLIFGFQPLMDGGLEFGDEIELTPEYGFNEMDIDFAALAETETDQTLKQMNLYFDSVTPSKQNEKTGIFAGKNLVMIVAESFCSYAVNETYTPTLYKMQTEGYTFTNFYNPIWGVSTSDGEYVATTGLLPKPGVWSMRESSTNSLPFTMGNQFRKLGIETRAYHNHYAEYYDRTESHPNLGYLYKGLGTGLNVKEQWPESDHEMLVLSTPEYLTPYEFTVTNDDGTTSTTSAIAPFHVYYMTVSGHLNYNFMGQAMCVRHKDKVMDLDMSEACQAYIASQIELDLAMEHLLTELEKAGQLENTVIVISGDHYPYGLTSEQISEFLGHPVDEKYEIYKSSLIIYNPGMEPETIDKYCSSLDIIPTVSNLFGLEFDSRLLMGRDIFSDTDPLVIFKDRSWISDKGKYDAQTGVFTPFETVTEVDDSITSEGAVSDVSEDYINGIISRVDNRFNYSRLILERDYYRYLGL
ncbi:MAG: LTA synthase family protein [Clostridiales bacterium]|nr:LTA synthase family protein [Clostridiales bacterium]